MPGIFDESPCPATDTDTVALCTAIARVRKQIDAACIQAGRRLDEVRLLPVSKTVSIERLRQAHAVGMREFGENKVQEALTKSEAMADLADLNWVLIGHLQTNKTKYVARFCSEFQALDNLRVAAALDTQLQKQSRALDVLIQVNTSNEASKFGLPPENVPAFVRELPAFSSLRVRGLMTLALFSPDAAKIRPCFVRLRELRDELRQSAPDGIGLDELSMGMSGDFALAIAEGATTVRVGTAIFGQRNTPDSLYWPTLNPPSIQTTPA